MTHRFLAGATGLDDGDIEVWIGDKSLRGKVISLGLSVLSWDLW
jgi:hypothetical protein